jgi:DNA polymerase I-like protein with 3'-5' exonuclease and polymerase domains
MSLIFDLESDGLLKDATKIHCLEIYDNTNDKWFHCSNQEGYLSVAKGIKLLQEADEIAGHNIVKFDIPIIQKLYPNFKPKGKVFDTLLMSKLIYPDIGEIDDNSIRKNIFPKKLRGRYSLKAWGYRLKEYKGDYCEQENCWAEWTSDMQRYCEQDVMVTKKLFEFLKSKNISETSIELEHKFAKIIGLQEQRGVYFDKLKAIDLAGKLVQEKENLERELKHTFQNEIREEIFIPKVNNKTKGYIKGQPFIKKIVIEFNPSSRQMLAERLIKKYGWKPKKLSPTGLPVIDEEVLSELKYPEAPLLQRYFLVTKTLGQLADGKNAWLKLEKNSVIYGKVDTIGAVTGRCTHNSPNLAQTPSGHSAFGKECRELFKARKGYKLVGCDASGLELRMLAHYMNDKDYTHEILHGDIHTANQKAAGLPTRDNAKTFIYGFLYGAGDSKIGSITGKGAKEGKRIKDKFLKSLPKLAKLTKGVKQRITERGYLKGIDGRILKVREQYKGLNVLLQSAGAIVMKKALCILYDDCVQKGWIKDNWYLTNDNLIYFILNIHDEYQAEVSPEIVEEYKVMAVEAIKKAGEFFKMRCPLTGEAKEGENWYQTH